MIFTGKLSYRALVKQEILRLADYGFDLTSLNQSTWIKVQNPKASDLERALLKSLDKGESSAIALAYELKADYLAIDERAGRKKAQALGIKIIGLIGILIQAKKAKIIQHVRPILEQLISEANFYVSEQLYQVILLELGEED